LKISLEIFKLIFVQPPAPGRICEFSFHCDYESNSYSRTPSWKFPFLNLVKAGISISSVSSAAQAFVVFDSIKFNNLIWFCQGWFENFFHFFKPAAIFIGDQAVVVSTVWIKQKKLNFFEKL